MFVAPTSGKIEPKKRSRLRGSSRDLGNEKRGENRNSLRSKKNVALLFTARVQAGNFFSRTLFRLCYQTTLVKT